ncbi:hypothetical protein K438DRAFT_1840945 [Mycena galopus ATCC 62051]|nr:hypothetical protein K438DRAFT_1840945 [Mycena galopus ATCC 62051]
MASPSRRTTARTRSIRCTRRPTKPKMRVLRLRHPRVPPLPLPLHPRAGQRFDVPSPAPAPRQRTRGRVVATRARRPSAPRRRTCTRRTRACSSGSSAPSRFLFPFRRMRLRLGLRRIQFQFRAPRRRPPSRTSRSTPTSTRPRPSSGAAREETSAGRRTGGARGCVAGTMRVVMSVGGGIRVESCVGRDGERVMWTWTQHQVKVLHPQERRAPAPAKDKDKAAPRPGASGACTRSARLRGCGRGRCCFAPDTPAPPPPPDSTTADEGLPAGSRPARTSLASAAAKSRCAACPRTVGVQVSHAVDARAPAGAHPAHNVDACPGCVG